MAEARGHAPQSVCETDPSGFQPEAVLNRFDFLKWQPRVGSHHQPSGSEPDAPLIELRGHVEMDPPTGVAPVHSPLPMTCAALCALAESKRVGPAGNAPALSSPPDWRIAFFLWPVGGAPRTRTG
jgi:hypothetical protein